MSELMGDQAALVREDARLVAAAANDGRISPDNAPNWMMAMKADRAATRKTLASLVSVRAALSSASGVDPDVEHAERGLRASLGRMGIKAPPRSTSPRAVTASADPRADARERVVLDMLGLPIAQVPDPVVIARAKPAEQWTAQERSDWFMHQLGPAVTRGGGVNRPPRSRDVIYQPSPHDMAVWVETGNGQGEFRPKDYTREARVVD